jgi:flagellar motor switch protein FliM
MTPETTLSGDEIEALMGRDRRTSGRGGSEAREPRSFAFGTGSAPASAALPALDRLNERLAKRLRDLFEPILRAKPLIHAEPAMLRPLRDWQAEQPAFLALSLYNFKPLKGMLAVSIPADFVSRLVDSYYGGSGASPLTAGKEFTRTEERLVARVSDGLTAMLADTWKEVTALELQLKARETNVAAVRIAGPDDAVVVCRFAVTPSGGKATQFDILFPAAALRSVEGALATRTEEGCARGNEWRAQLGSALADVRIEARTVLARPELTLAELVQLKVGDVIPVSIPASVPLLVEGRTVAVGSIGEQDGKAALRIERIQRGSRSQ